MRSSWDSLVLAFKEDKPNRRFIERINQEYPPNMGSIDLDGVMPWGVLFSSRSGSTLISRLIAKDYKTNVPHEDFSLARQSSMSRMPVNEIGARIKALSKYGVYGVKLGRQSLLRTIRLGLFDYGEDPSFVFVQRADILAQSTSLALAKATGNWHRFGKAVDTVSPLSSDEIRNIAVSALREAAIILDAARTFLRIATILDWRFIVAEYEENGKQHIPRIAFLDRRVRPTHVQTPEKILGRASVDVHDYLEGHHSSELYSLRETRQRLSQEIRFFEAK